jgi:hypothetical protein
MNRIAYLSLLLASAIGPTMAAGQQAASSLGYIKVQEGLTAVVCSKTYGQCTITGGEGRARLPVGKYYVEKWTVERIDEEGNCWELRGTGTADKRTFNVAEGMETELAIGEPAVSVLAANREGSLVGFEHKLRGQLGEEIRLVRKQPRADPPRLLIRNEDGSYQETLTFKYR